MTSYPIPDSALDDRLAIVGVSGSGKTYAAMTAVERLQERAAKVVIVDPLGVWWGLRLKANGKAPAFPVVIFGGQHADIPITEASGRLLGETVAGMAESCIIDLSELGSKAAERRFMLALLEGIYRKASGSLFHLVFDEADLWAPQRTPDPQLLGVMENIVRRGRVKGFVPWLITQRPAVISKDVLSQVDGLIAMKLVSKHDRDALGAWIEGQADKAEEKSFKARLPTMKRGHGIVWIPGKGILEDAAFPAKTTFDSSSAPKRGEVRRAAALEPINIGKLKAAIAALEVEQAKPKAGKAAGATANAPAATNAAQRATSTIVVPDPRLIREAEDRGRRAGFEDGVRAGTADGYNRALKEVRAAIGVLKPSDPKLALHPSALAVRTGDTIVGPDSARLTVGKTTKQPASQVPETPAGEFKISRPQQAILDALRWFEGIGVDKARKEILACLADASSTSSVFQNNLGHLRSQLGLISYPGSGEVALTDQGRSFANVPERALTHAELHAAVRAKLTPSLVRILDVAIACYPTVLSKVDLADQVQASATSSVYQNNLGRLRSLGFISYPGPGLVCAADLLFPAGMKAA